LLLAYSRGLCKVLKTMLGEQMLFPCAHDLYTSEEGAQRCTTGGIMASISDNAQEIFSNSCHTELQQALVSEWQCRPALAS